MTSTKTWIFHTIVDPEWEVKKSDIRLLNVLGDGAFGRVYFGELIDNAKITKCAVKKLKSNARSEERENFLKEANIMKSVSLPLILIQLNQMFAIILC